MTNKGQSLVIFILLIPILFILISLLWDVGNLLVITSKYESEVKKAVSYGVKKKDHENLNEEIKNLLDVNIKGEKNIEINDTYVRVNVKDRYKSVYEAIFKKIFDIDITYIGYKENEKIIIKKE